MPMDQLGILHFPYLKTLILKNGAQTGFEPASSIQLSYSCFVDRVDTRAYVVLSNGIKPFFNSLGGLCPSQRRELTGAEGEDRTHDLFLTKKLHFHCATSALLVPPKGIKPLYLLSQSSALSLSYGGII